MILKGLRNWYHAFVSTRQIEGEVGVEEIELSSPCVVPDLMIMITAEISVKRRKGFNNKRHFKVIDVKINLLRWFG